MKMWILLKVGMKIDLKLSNNKQPLTKGNVWGIIGIYVFVFIILIPSILLMIGIQLDAYLQFIWNNSYNFSIPGFIFLGIGIFVMVGSMLQLSLQGKGLPISHLPPEKLISKYFYRLVRNPIYYGFILLVTGIGILLKSTGILVISLPILLTGTYSYLKYFEEPVLLRRFGEKYELYMKRSPLLFPITGRIIKLPLFRQFQKVALMPFNFLANGLVLFRYRNAIFVNYGLLNAIGITLWVWHDIILAYANGLTTNQIWVLLVGNVTSGFIGARAYWYIEHFKALIKKPFWGFLEIGFVSWGVVIGIVAFLIPYTILNDISFFLITDIVFSGMFIGYSIGRLGCLTYGCCFGKETKGVGVTFKNLQSKVNRTREITFNPRYPTQLYSAIHGLALVLILNGLIYYEVKIGMVTVLGMIFYGTGRGFEEFNRDRSKIKNSPFTEGHVGSLILIIFGVLLTLFPIGQGKWINRWNSEAIYNSLDFLPAMIVVFFVLFFLLSFHRKTIGKW